MTAVLSPLRRGRITGSRLPKLLGISPYGSRDDLLRELVREHYSAPDEFTGNLATEYGQDHEDDAIAEYERVREVMVHSGQTFHKHPTLDFLGITPDGFVGDLTLVEVKCPFRGSYTDISERPDYEAQVRLQLECTGRPLADFVVWRPSGINVSEVVHDPDWLPSVLPAIAEFMAELAEHIADPKLTEQHLAPLVNVRSDEDWQIAEIEYLEARAEVDRADEVMENARQRLIELADGKPTRGQGVQLIRSVRKGTLPYSKVVKANLPDLDLEQYRGPESVVFTVRKV